jgi:hypothetical protein
LLAGVKLQVGKARELVLVVEDKPITLIAPLEIMVFLAVAVAVVTRVLTLLVLVAMVLLLAVAVAETGPCLQQALLVETLLHIAVGLPLEAVLVVEEQAT